MANPRSLDQSSGIVKQLLDDYASGKLTYNRIIYDAIVIDMDDDGGTFSDDCPQDTIKFRLITDSADRFIKDGVLNLAWPLLSVHQRYPLKKGERVKILYEFPNAIHGWWYPTTKSKDNFNYVPWNDIKNSEDNEDAAVAFGDKDSGTANNNIKLDVDVVAQQSGELASPTDQDVSGNTIPKFNKGHDEHVLNGSDNSMIRLGRDRHGEIGSGYDSGAVDIIVGRSGQNPSYDDAAREVLVEKTDIDSHLQTPNNINTNESSAKAIVADTIRIKARKDIVIWLNDSVWISFKDNKIEIGGTNSLNGQLVTENSVCRHKCPFVSWAQTNPSVEVETVTVAVTPPPIEFAPDAITALVESRFSANAGPSDHSESNHAVEIID